MSEYRHTTASLAAELGITDTTLRKRAKSLGLGINLDGRAGYRYSDADRHRLIESLRPKAEPEKKRRRRRAA